MKHAKGPSLPSWPCMCILRMTCLLALILAPSGALLAAGAGTGSDLAVPYTVEFSGVQDSELQKELQQTSATAQNTDTPPETLGLLRRRARKDLDRMTEVLKAHGRFDAQIELHVQDRKGNEPALIQFVVSTGPEYTIRRVDFRFPDAAAMPSEDLPTREDLGLPPEAAATADAIRQGKSIVLSELISKGYALAQVDSPQVYVRSQDKCVDIVYPVHPGPKARFGPVRIQGLNRVEEEYVRSKIPWDRGDIYDPRAIRSLQNNLLKTGLFNLVQVDHPQFVDRNSQLPLTIKVHEVDHKRVSLRLGYETDIGAKGGLSWENNNLWGVGRDLGFGLEVSGIRQELEGRYAQEGFLEQNTDLVLSASLFREDSEAFMTTGGKASAHLEHQLRSHLRLGGGLGYKGSRVEDAQGEEVFHQFSLPVFALFDTRDDPLDPTAGTYLNLRTTPMLGLLGEEFSLLKSSLSTRWYSDLLPDKGRAVLALRGKLGIINASSTREVPADERWYAGGGGSIRGYPYQKVGPYREGDPFGGRSLLETSAELRWKWGRKIGSVAFIDAGNVYDSTFPDPADKIYWGAGAGLRYYTGIGPFRVDVAFPLTSDRHIDDSFQVYISLGQAF